MEAYPQQQVIHRKRSFLSTLALGVSGLAVTLVLSSAAIILYGMNIADRKATDVAAFIEQAVQGLPELHKILPPALADAIRDHREPEYVKNIDVSAEIVPLADPELGVLPTIELTNRGDEVVSLLSMRVVLVDRTKKNFPVAVWSEFGATPIATGEREWRGPLLPGARRIFAPRTVRVHRRPFPHPEDLDVEVEITDLRVWDGARAVRKQEI